MRASDEIRGFLQRAVLVRRDDEHLVRAKDIRILRHRLQTRIVQRHAWTKIHELHQSYAGLGPQLLKISLFEGLNENGRVPPVPLVLGE